jgi:hypothetical protein
MLEAVAFQLLPAPPNCTPTPAVSANWNAVPRLKVEEILRLDSSRMPAPMSR